MSKLRLDQLLVERGLAPSRERARALVMAGRVRAAGRLYTKPGQPVPPDLDLSVVAGPPFVSRGGEKLQAALERWPLPVQGALCLDLGASTGGFTDCLLQHGAARVYAVDVGRGQLAPSLRADPRVVPLDEINARTLPPLDPPPALVTIDLSFISARLVLPAVAAVATPGAHVLLLVKPQFEAGREAVHRGGVVRDPRDRAAAVRAVALWAWRQGWRIGGVLASPLRGPAGNREFFLWLCTPPAGPHGSASARSPSGHA